MVCTYLLINLSSPFLYFSWRNRSFINSREKNRKKRWNLDTILLVVEEPFSPCLISRGSESSLRTLFSATPTRRRVITVVGRILFPPRMLAAPTGNSMDSTQSNNKRGPASFILFQLPLQMAAGTGRETSHGDVSGNGSVMGKKKKREEKERKKRSSRGSRLLLSRCNIRRNKPARVSFFLVWIYARHGSEREWRRKATGNGRWRCFPNGGQLIVGETEFLGESRFFIRVDGERYSISKTSNARSEENSNWEAMKIEWNGKENWYLYITVYTYIVQVFEKWSRKEDDDKKKKNSERNVRNCAIQALLQYFSKLAQVTPASQDTWAESGEKLIRLMEIGFGVWISVAAELFPELSGKTCGFWKRVTRPPPASSSSLPDHASSDIDGSWGSIL